LTALQPWAAPVLRTILLLKRYCFKKPRFFGHQFAALLVGIAVVIFAPNMDAAARHKANFRVESPSKLSCSRTNLRCPRRPPKVAAVKPKTKTTSKKHPSAKRLAKPASKPRAAKAPAANENIQLAVKPQRKPALPKPPTERSPTYLPEIVLHVPKPQMPQKEYRPNPFVDGSDCRNELAKLGAEFSIPAEVKGTGVCHVTDPVQLRSVTTPTGRIDLPGTPLLNCVFARQFVVWLSDIAAPVVAGLGAAKLASISTGTSYQCRVRNGDFSGKMSEHAFGNAIDIAGIALTNKKRIEITAVADPEDPDRRLLMALRTSACGYFTTVLGPGADAAHASHYHFDLGVHGNDSNYRICE
jgi:hypothetical protein